MLSVAHGAVGTCGLLLLVLALLCVLMVLKLLLPSPRSIVLLSLLLRLGVSPAGSALFVLLQVVFLVIISIVLHC